MTASMGYSWMLVVLFFAYPLAIIGFNRFVRYRLPCKKTRKRFLQDNEYLNKLLYLLMPLLVLHLELMLLQTDYPFYEINNWIIIVLVVLQCYLFFIGIACFRDLIGNLKKLRKQLDEC